MTARARSNELDPRLLGPCMIYCGYCGVYKAGKCAGCGPMTDKRAKQRKVFCRMRECADKRCVKMCADCDDYPCDWFDKPDSEDIALFSKGFIEYIRENR